MYKGFRIVGFKNIVLMSAVCFCLTTSSALASDNVLQAIQVDGVNDSYNVILKSDDVAEVRKTIQAPNKMILLLKGIRASKTINTIYNNTSSVDSVVVEPMGDDSVKVLIQADNAAGAEVKFDTLKTPLGVLEKSSKQNKPADELVLNEPMQSYKPVYDNSDNTDEDESGFSLAGAQGSVIRHIKDIAKNGKTSWVITFGMFAILIMSGIKTIKGKDNEIKVGLSQSLKEREIDLYRRGLNIQEELASNSLNPVSHSAPLQTSPGANYGLKAYQNGTRSPYASAEMQRPRPTVAPQPSINPQQAMAKNLSQRATIQSQIQTQNITQQSALKTAPSMTSVNAKPKTTNIDSMKFLESMTKIYEKNGRADLAKGLKANMKKAKINLA